MQKQTLAAFAAITVALGLAVVPALTNQVFAAFPNEGRGHATESENRGGHAKDTDSAAAKCVQIEAGKSGNVKFQDPPEGDPKADKCDFEG